MQLKEIFEKNGYDNLMDMIMDMFFLTGVSEPF